MTNATKTVPAVDPVEQLKAVIHKYVRTDGPTKGLVNAQDYNRMTAEALAAYLTANSSFNTIEECELLLEGKVAKDFFALWLDVTDNMVYDSVQLKPEKSHDDDGNEVTHSVPVPHRLIVNSRLDKFAEDIKNETVSILKQELRDRPIKFPEREPNRVKFLEALRKLPVGFNAQNPAEAATSMTAFVTNICYNRGIDGARRQQKLAYLQQPQAGNGGKGLTMDSFEGWAKAVGLCVGTMDPTETKFVSEDAAYVDVLICPEVKRLQSDCFSVINPIVDNIAYRSQRKHCNSKTVKSRATVIMASQFEYPDPNRRRVAPVIFAANSIEDAKADDLKYFAAFHPVKNADGIVRFKADTDEVRKAWSDVFKYCVFDAVYKDPSVSDDKKIFPHSYLKALQIMQQVRDADAGDGRYAQNYGTPLGCKVKTEYRDLDHCIRCLQRAQILDTHNSKEVGTVKTCLAQLVNTAQRRGFWGESKKGIRADRLPFSAYDFDGCSVDAPDIEEGYSFSAISCRWDRLIAAYTEEVPQDPNKGGKDNDGHREDQGGHSGHPEKSEAHQVDERRAAAVHSGGTVGAADICGDVCLHGQPADHHDSADKAEDDRGGLDATIDQLLDSYAGTGVASTTSPACTADNKPGTSFVCAQVSPTPSGHVVGGLTTQCKSGDFIFPDNIIGSTVTINGEDKVLDGICCTWHPDNTLACFNKTTTGTDCMPIDKWDADPGKSSPEYLVNCVNKPGCTGRHTKDVYPTYIVFEADHVSKEAQLKNINWSKARGHICSITDSMKRSYAVAVPLGEAGIRITDNDTMKLVCKEVGEKFFYDASILDPATWRINNLMRCPGGIRTKKDDDDNGPWVGAVQRQIYANPDATPPANIDDIVDRAVAKRAAAKLRAAFFDNQVLENEEEALEKLDNYYRKHANSNTLTEELDIAHEVVCAGVVDPASGVNWLGGLNCLRGYRMPRAVLETYLNRVREVHPTHLPQDNDYYLEDYGRKEVA